jgi:hypothetical protein
MNTLYVDLALDQRGARVVGTHPRLRRLRFPNHRPTLEGSVAGDTLGFERADASLRVEARVIPGSCSSSRSGGLPTMFYDQFWVARGGPASYCASASELGNRRHAW